MNYQELYDLSLQARENSYCPYSHFATGAALVGESGRIYLGCNVENSAFGPTNCAERTAVFKAVSEGERRFTAIAVCGAPEGKVPDKLCAPCGVCRQVLSEFVDDDFPVIMYDEELGVKAYPFREILPFRFDLNEY
ncbi:MAG: cytidine deaminase [Lachnospiraceae bacterium]|nr:cytidine deaminase [Lachnospiraceae bacterium]MBQ6242857.1 cytidine deaminase [Lachnospiraceae bacterium]